MTVTFDDNGHAITAGEICVYYYSQENKEYLGWSNEYIPVGVSIPGYSTLVNPGDDIPGYVWVYDGGTWESKEDHRGETVYNDETGEAIFITEIGPYPDGTSTEPPPIPEPTNEEKRKVALSELSSIYQTDITKLNISWLAAAVSDGVNETVKKDAVITQINDRKTQYAADRAAIIAQYPED